MARRFRDLSLLLVAACLLGLLIQHSHSTHIHMPHRPHIWKFGTSLSEDIPGQQSEDPISISESYQSPPESVPEPGPGPELTPTPNSLPPTTPPSRIEKLSMLFGKYEPIYEDAVNLQIKHSERHGYKTTVLRHEILDYMWNKPALVLHRLLEELMKPNPDDRLEWLWWFDSDTVILNPSIPLSLFHPPPMLDDIVLLVANDFNGLNFGAFAIRVCPEAVTMIAAVIAYRTYRPEGSMTYHEQSAMAALLEEDTFRDSCIFVPQRWFNAYRPHAVTPSAEVRSGDLLVHLAGVGGREKAMTDWLNYARLTANDTIASSVSPELEAGVRLFYDRFADARERIMEAEIALENVGEAKEGGDDKSKVGGEQGKALSMDVIELRRLLAQDAENADAIRLSVEDVGRGIERLNHRLDLESTQPSQSAIPSASVPMPESD